MVQIKSNKCYVYSPKSQSHSLSGLCSETRDSRKEKLPILKKKELLTGKWGMEETSRRATKVKVRERSSVLTQ